MLILSESQARNYFKKLIPDYHNEDCGCCTHSTRYEIKNKRILEISYGTDKGYSYFNVTVIAIIKKRGKE